MSRLLRGRAILALLGGGLPLLIAAPVASAALSPGDLVVADSQAFGGSCPVHGCGGLIAVDPSSGAESELSANTMPVNAGSGFMGGPFTLAINSSGEIIVGETEGLGGSCSGGCGGLVEVNPTTGKQTVLSANDMAINAGSEYFGQVNGVTIDNAGEVIVSDWGGCFGCGKVIGVDPADGKETLISSNAMPVNAGSQLFAYPQGLALEPNGNILVADATAFASGGGIIEVDRSTGKESEVSSNSMAVNSSSQYFTGIGGLAIDDAGDILAADWGGGTCCGKIVQVDPSTGKESIFSSNAMPVNALTQYFEEPVGITIGQSGNIFVADEGAFGPCSPGCGGVIEVNPVTRAETEISSNTLAINSTDQLFTDPWSVAIVPAARGGTGGEETGAGAGGPGIGGTGGDGPGGDDSGGQVTASSGQILSQLATQLIPSGKAATIGALLKTGKYAATANARSGLLVVAWYGPAPALKSARRTRAKQTLIASGKATISTAGKGVVTIRLTAAGVRLLRRAARIRVTAKDTFTPTGGKTMSIVRTFVLSR